MNDSPWARTIYVTLGLGFEMQPMGNAPATNGPTMGNQQSQPGGGPPPTENQNATSMESTSMFEVRWISSLTMRQALARLSILEGKMSQAAAEQYLANSPANYEIALFGQNMSAFRDVAEAALARDSWLEMKTAKRRVAPASVKIQKSADGKQIAVTFAFPKNVNGEPTIAPNEKGIDFVCRVKDLNLKFHFDPRKMVNQQGRDL